MITQTENQKKTLAELQDTITKAMNIVNVKKETDLCRYIPGPKSSKGRLHHFVFGMLKKTKPEELLSMIKEHILEKEQPTQVSSKPRADLMVKRTADITLKRSQVNKLLNALKKMSTEIPDAKDLISMLSPHQTLKQVQKLMIVMIRAKEVDVDLWETYTKLVEEQRNVLQQK